MSGIVNIGEPLKEIIAKQAKLYITVGGTRYFFAAAKNVRVIWRYNPIEEPVCGSQIPRVLTGVFHGEFEPEWIYTTDALLTLNQPDASFEVPNVTVELEDRDVRSPPVLKKITFTCKIFDLERVGPANADGVVRLRGRGILTSAPTFTQS